MTSEHGWQTDAWLDEVWPKVDAADILVVGGPLWLGDNAQHIGYVIPPAADAGWIGEVGPGPSYLDPGSGGPENDFTNRNTTFMTWNLLHLARMLKDTGGIRAFGNLREAWNEGERFGFDTNPEYR